MAQKASSEFSRSGLIFKSVLTKSGYNSLNFNKKAESFFLLIQ